MFGKGITGCRYGLRYKFVELAGEFTVYQRSLFRENYSLKDPDAVQVFEGYNLTCQKKISVSKLPLRSVVKKVGIA